MQEINNTMVLDYKDVSFSFNDARKSKRIKRIRLIGLAIVVVLLVVAVLNFIDSGRINTAQDLLLSGKQNEARDYIKNLQPSLFHGDRKKELKALLHLSFREYTEARTVLTALGRTATGIDPARFLNYFADRAAYRELQIYTDYQLNKLAKNQDSQSLLFFKALYSSALFQPQVSEAAIASMPVELKQLQKKALGLIQRINRQVLSGKVEYIFDVNGKPMAYYDLATQKTMSLTAGMNFDAFTHDMRTGIKFYGLTLDRDVQAKLQVLFKGLNGTFLLFNVNDSSIVAAYSNSLAQPASATTNAVFTHQYEPGSIVKPLTLLTYFNTKPTAASSALFPLECTGTWQLKDHVFSDWMVHKQVANTDEALAVSCNIAFARLGLQLGHTTLRTMFNRFYFNTPALKDLFLEFKTGKTSDTITTDFQLANMAVGLNHVTMTTFHAALVFTIIAENGSIYEPYMIKSKKNLLDIGYYNHGSRLLTILTDNSAFLKVKNAMVYVVESADGTGRRAKVDGVMMAIKTGTAGNKQLGLDAILTGFFPAEKPRYAFAFQLERAGKAEWRGALFLKDFLTTFYLPQSRLGSK